MNLLPEVDELIQLSNALFDELNWENYEEAKVTIRMIMINAEYLGSQLEGK